MVTQTYKVFLWTIQKTASPMKQTLYVFQANSRLMSRIEHVRFLRFFAQLQILPKLRFFSILVIFVYFAVLVGPFEKNGDWSRQNDPLGAQAKSTSNGVFSTGLESPDEYILLRTSLCLQEFLLLLQVYTHDIPAWLQNHGPNAKFSCTVHVNGHKFLPSRFHGCHRHQFSKFPDFFLTFP